MIEIPIGKALVPVEIKMNPALSMKSCASMGCYFGHPNRDCRTVGCAKDERKDGIAVIYKLVDYLDYSPEKDND